MSLDYELFRWINGVAGSVPPLDLLMRLLVNEYFIPTAISLVLVALWFGGATRQERERNQRALFGVVVTFLLANLIVKACNLVFIRPRPFAFHEVNLLFYHPSDSSFPSNPAAVAFSLAAGVWLFGGQLEGRRVGGWLYGLASLFALARVYCGVHYPLDIVGGAAVGIGAGYVARRLFTALDPLVQRLLAVGRRLFLA